MVLNPFGVRHDVTTFRWSPQTPTTGYFPAPYGLEWCFGRMTMRSLSQSDRDYPKKPSENKDAPRVEHLSDPFRVDTWFGSGFRRRYHRLFNSSPFGDCLLHSVGYSI